MQIAAELQYGVQPILGPKALCGQLPTVDKSFIGEFLERHDCTVTSDVGVEISKRFNPETHPTPAFFTELREKYPSETAAFCEIVSGLSLPNNAILDDEAALATWTQDTGEKLDAADAILNDIRKREAAANETPSDDATQN